MMGFLVYHKEQVQLAEYKVDSEGFVRAANRLMSWDSAVVLEDLRSWIPTAEADTVGGTTRWRTTFAIVSRRFSAAAPWTCLP